MRILFDLIGASTDSRLRGIGRYTRSLACELARRHGQDATRQGATGQGATGQGGPEDALDFALAGNFPQASADLRALLDQGACGFYEYHTPRAKTYAAPAGDPARKIGQAIHRRMVACAGPDVYLSSSFFELHPPDFAPLDPNLYSPRAMTAIVYDFIPWIYKKSYLQTSAIRRCYQEQMRALAGCDLLLAISECTRQDAIRLLKISPDKVVNISGAADPFFAPVDIGAAQTRLAALRARAPFVLIASGNDKRKNLAAALTAFFSLKAPARAGAQLVLVAPLDADEQRRIRAQADKAGLAPDDLAILPDVNDADLRLLYSACALFVFPSLYEGFGLPALEAMQCGAPVLVADNSSQREIVNRPDLRFDAAQPRAIARAIAKALNDVDFLQDARQWGLERSTEFSWTRTADQALAALREAARRQETRPRPLPAAMMTATGFEAEAAAVIKTIKDPRDSSALAENAAEAILQTCPRLFDPQNAQARRLFVDVTAIAARDARTGIQRVVRNLLASLYRAQKSPLIAQAVRLTDGRLMSCESFIAAQCGVQQITPDEEICFRPGDHLLMLDNSWQDFARFQRIFDQLRACGGRSIAALYDLIPLVHRGASVDDVPEVFAQWLAQALVSCDAMLAISQTVAQDLKHYIAREQPATRDGFKVDWWRLGADFASPSGAPSQRVVQMFTPDAPTFLVVGTLEPRKGHAIVLQAFETLWRAGFLGRLVFIGRRGWHVETLLEKLCGHSELNKKLFWLDDCGDGDLAYAYTRARAAIVASYAEGYGLPLSEAAAFDCPVICSDIPVFREIGREGAIYFAVNDSAALTQVLRDFVSGKTGGDPSRVLRTTWRESAADLLAALARL